MSDRSGRHWLVFNGEIYNHIAIRQLLEREGISFRTSSDTEVVLAALVHWGFRAVERLEGMFAFAFWDSVKETLLLARDRFGMKPLYVCRCLDAVAFASELTAFPPAISQRFNVDREALRDFLVYRYIPSPRTIFSEVSILPPGHWLEIHFPVGAALPSAHCWYRLSTETERSITLEDAAAELNALLANAGSEHLISDVPLGVFLSGGLDSSAVCAYAAAASGHPLVALTVGFPDSAADGYDESKYARETAQHLGCEHRTLALAEEAVGILPRVVKSLGEPMADPSILPTFLMAAEARRTVKGMLSGDGGDEVFGGYNRYRRVSRELRSDWSGRFQALLAGASRSSDTRPLSVYERYMHLFSPREAMSLLRPAFRPEARFVPLHERFDVALGRDPLTQWQELDLKTYLPDDNLMKVDRLSMAHGLEVRVPLLDRRIVEFGFSLPANLRSKGRKGKLVLRRALAERLPAKVIHRKKSGFKVPLGAWRFGGTPVALNANVGTTADPLWNILDPKETAHCFKDGALLRGEGVARMFALSVLSEWMRR